MSKYYYHTILLLILSIVACKKEDCDSSGTSSTIVLECYEFQDLFQTYFTRGRYQFQKPHCNPMNENEIVYQYIDYEDDIFELLKYNLVTGEVVSLGMDIRIITQPKWSSTGRVAFDNVLDYQIWTVKDNGDSLLPFTDTPYNLYPAWSDNGQELLWQSSFNLGVPRFLVKQTISGNSIDTLFQGANDFNDISVNNQIATRTYIGSDQHIISSEIESFEINNILNLSQIGLMGHSHLSWDNTGEFLYLSVWNNSDVDGLFKIDVSSGEYERLIEFCDSKRYDYISCSSSGNFIIGERVDRYLVDTQEGIPTGEIRENSSIYKIDLTTLEEVKIELQ